MKTEAIRPLQGRRLLLAITGSIAAVKIPMLISNLVKAGAEVRCLISPSASSLVSPLSISTLSRNRCYQDEDQWKASEPRPLHIALAEWADLVVVAPLSASSLSRWVQGLADGIIPSVLLACEKPVIAAAAMNTAMWNHAAVQRNWEYLQNDPKVLCLSPSNGLLACDRTGEGRIVEIGLLQLAIESALINKSEDASLQKDWKGKRLLITAGPTIEDLDPVRYISNRSSGGMGVLLAQAANFRGATVDLIHGPLQVSPALLDGLNLYPVRSAKQMQIELANLHASADAIAMTAAVADLKKKGAIQQHKPTKESLIESLQNGLETVPDLLAELVANRTQKTKVILGFAALSGNDLEIKKLGEAKKNRKGCDLMMVNPIDRPGQGFEQNLNGGVLLGPNGMSKKIPITSKLALAHQLLDAIRELETNFSYKK